MSRWETQRKPWNKAPGWRGETPDEQKGSLLCNGPLVVYSSRLSARASAVIPIRSDGNASHIFSPHWSPHARFHGVVSMGMLALLAPASVFLLWRRSTDPETATTMAALIPIARLRTVFRGARHSRCGSGGSWPAPHSQGFRACTSLDRCGHVSFGSSGMVSGPFRRYCCRARIEIIHLRIYADR
jgi:hypothetical protein